MPTADQDDASLLRHYAAEGSEPAFRELVRRHLAMVHATARRVIACAPHLADDIAQNAFTDLAKKAATLPKGTVLAGWLHRHTCYLALNAVRAENRRQARERTAMEMHAVNNNAGVDEHWARLAPVLDEALNHLEVEDRDAIVLRYLEQRDLRSVGLAIGVSEDTAQKRVTRALDKLRGLLRHREITVSATVLAATLDAGSVASTQASLAVLVSATAVTTAATTAGFSLTPGIPMISLKLILGLTATITVAGFTTFTMAHRGSHIPPASPQNSPTAITRPTGMMAATSAIADKVELPKLPPKPATEAADVNEVVTTPSAHSVTFMGAVNKSGQIEVPESKVLTLAQAFAAAGGPLPSADQYVTITRINPNGTTTILADIDLLAAVKDGERDIPLQEGDIITLGRSAASNVWK